MCGRTAYSATSTAAAARELSNEIEKNCKVENNEEVLTYEAVLIIDRILHLVNHIISSAVHK